MRGLHIATLIVAFAGLMATACFGLYVLLINVVDRLWPSKAGVLKDKGEVREEFPLAQKSAPHQNAETNPAAAAHHA